MVQSWEKKLENKVFICHKCKKLKRFNSKKATLKNLDFCFSKI